ncbi:MAG: amidohydrolase [Bacteroidetes bacterium]|nr:amidohydrolase [Bacteroidota bacterium]
MTPARLLFTLLLLIPAFVSAQKPPAETAVLAAKRSAMQRLQADTARLREAAMAIWGFAEVGYKEVRSSALLAEMLEQEGFRMEKGVAGIPTAFVATYGSDHPIIGILAEYDALPGLSQQAIAEKRPVVEGKPGHGCGHHLFGTASVAAGIALRHEMERNGWKGTVKVFGCPAEEGGSGKVYMVREGLFKDVDVALHWHPGSENSVAVDGALANKSAKFRFYGRSAHAAMAPDLGRSALDAVEAMNHMVNLMREHVPQDTRIHYVITSGGKAPNVIPDFAEVYYYVRHPDKRSVMEIFDRVLKAAEGASLGTETSMKYEVIGGTHDLLVNRSLAEALQPNLVLAGGVEYTPEEAAFAAKIQATLTGKGPAIATAAAIRPIAEPKGASPGSTDVGDVSYTLPTVGFGTATWVPGTPAHSWQAVACGGTSIGVKGMMTAAKALANMGIDLLTKPAIITQAKEEFIRSKGDYRYTPLLGNRKPALDYRD